MPGWVRRGGPDRRGPQRAAAWPVAPPVRPFLRRARQRRPGGHRGDRPPFLARRLVRKRGRAARSARRGRARHPGRHGVRPEPGVRTDIRAQEPGPRQGRRRHPHRDHRRKRVSDRLSLQGPSARRHALRPGRARRTRAQYATSATCASPWSRTAGWSTICPAEPEPTLKSKGGRQPQATGRVCLCNALFAAAGLAQRRHDGYLEAPIFTGGADLDSLRRLSPRRGRLLGNGGDVAPPGAIAGPLARSGSVVPTPGLRVPADGAVNEC